MIAKIDWDQSYETGNANIDRQHQRILEMLSSLPEQISPAQRKYVFSELAKHVNENFVEEERLMKQASYSGYEAHKKQHDRLLEDLLALQEQFEKQSPSSDLSSTARKLIANWITTHILTEDALFAEFFRTPKKNR